MDPLRAPTDSAQSPSIRASSDLREWQFLEDRIDEENKARTGLFDARTLALLARDSAGRVIAGIHGWTWGASCEVKSLWVHADWRKQGLGTRLMTAAEQEARSRGAKQIVLSTHSFQAPAFYQRLGFECVGVVDDHPAGHRSVYLRKRI